jgi:hypothetical protein
MLGEAAELGLTLARDLAARARACEDSKQKAALVEAFDRMAREVCLNLACQATVARASAARSQEPRLKRASPRRGGSTGLH